MTKELSELHLQEANALALARFIRTQIIKLNKPMKKITKTDQKLIELRQSAEMSRIKRYN